MAVLRALIGVLGVSLLAAACSSGAAASALSADDYSTRLVEITSGDTPDADFPLGGSTVQVAGIFMTVEDSLSEFRSLRPPSGLEAIHAELVERFESVQEAVADYLQHHGMEGEEITLADVAFDTEISPRIFAAQEKCRELRLQLFDLDAPLPDDWCLV